jgi:archaemetzincin
LPDGSGFVPGALDVVPIPPFPAERADAVAVALSRRLDLACRVAPHVLDGDLPRLEGRGQVDADRLLARLEARADAAGPLLLGLTAEDLGNPIFTFFFGRARAGGRAALVSLARLEPSFYGLPEDETVTRRRTVLEALHELGHVVGLPHCADFGCVMHFARTVEDLDNRGRSFCGACRERLPFRASP